MQTCELCGWDTRSDTRVCTSCRQAGAGGSAADAPDDTLLLSAVLQSARSDRRPTTDSAATASQAPDATPPTPERRGARVVLRKVEADEPDDPTTARSQRSATSSITASLVAALTAPPEQVDDAGSRGGARDAVTAPDDLDDATDEIAVTTDQTAGPATDSDEPDGVAASRNGGQAAVADGGEAAHDTDSGEAAHDTDGPDDATADGPGEADSHEDASADGDDGDPTDGEPTDELPPVADADTSGATDGADVPSADADAPGAPAEASTGSDTTDAARPTAASESSDAAARPTDDDDDAEPKTVRERLRAGFEEMGAWAAVSQMGLLLIALLCVFQVVVLLVVHQFLAQVQTQDALAADLLVAHGRATNIMLPVLVVCALAAVAFAAWHARRATGEQSVTVRRWLGMPLRLWSVVTVAAAVQAVVLFDTATTIEQARLTTLRAIAACAALGVVALLSPRAIVVTDRDAASSAGGPHAVERDEAERDEPGRRAAV